MRRLCVLALLPLVACDQLHFPDTPADTQEPRVVRVLTTFPAGERVAPNAVPFVTLN